jgi:hypothetical protein
MIEFTTTAGGTGYIEVRMDPNRCEVHQLKIDVSEHSASDDADGMLPVGLPLQANGSPVTGASQTVKGVLGPRPLKLGMADFFGNAIFSGTLVQDAIEDNLGRALNANELAALAAGGFRLV